MRKIRAAIAEGEQLEKPIFTPCSAIGSAEKKELYATSGEPPPAMLTTVPDDDVIEAVEGPSPPETTLQKCNSWG